MTPSNHDKLVRLLHEREGLLTEIAMIEWRITELRDPLGLKSNRKPFWDKQGILQDFMHREKFFERLNRGGRQ